MIVRFLKEKNDFCSKCICESIIFLMFEISKNQTIGKIPKERYRIVSVLQKLRRTS